MAHRMHGASSALIVLKKAEGVVLQRALQKVLESETAAQDLSSLILDEEAPAADGPRSAAFAALLDSRSAECVDVLLALASRQPTWPDDLYAKIRTLPLAAVLRWCGCSLAEQVEACDEAGFTNVGDLLRYCDDSTIGDDGHLDALALETGGALQKDSLRVLLAKARELCDATSMHKAAWDGGQTALERACEAATTNPGAVALSTDPDDNDDESAVPDAPGTRSVGC